MEPESIEPSESASLQRLNQDLVRRVMNVLTEAPFFYLEDDRALFQYARRHRAAFRDFVKYYFGWDLVIDARCARLIKRGERENPELKSAHVDTFHLPRRNLSLVFLILLELFEIEQRRVNWQYERDAYLRFFHNDFFEYAKTRFRALLGERAPDDSALRRDVQETWAILIKYRFIRPIPPTPAELLVMDRKQGELYEFLPAVTCYDSNVLRDADWVARLKVQPEENVPAP